MCERQVRAVGGFANDFHRRGLVEKPASLVLGDEDRAQVPDRRSLPAQLRGRPTCPLRIAFERAQVCAGDVELDEEIRHASRHSVQLDMYAQTANTSPKIVASSGKAV